MIVLPLLLGKFVDTHFFLASASAICHLLPVSHLQSSPIISLGYWQHILLSYILKYCYVHTVREYIAEMKDTAYDQDANVEANVEPELNELSESKRYIVAFC